MLTAFLVGLIWSSAIAAQVSAPVPAASPKPVGDFGQWITPDDYPVASLRYREEGVVQFRLTINAAGWPTACAILRSSGWPRLDQRTCEVLMARASFTAVPGGGTFTQRVLWTLPPEPAEPVPTV